MNDKPPHTPIQAVGQAVETVATGLSNHPAMLSLVVLNMVGIGSALWFLQTIMTVSQTRYDRLLLYCFEERNDVREKEKHRLQSEGDVRIVPLPTPRPSE